MLYPLLSDSHCFQGMSRLYKKCNMQGRIKLVFISLKYTGFQIT